MTSRNRTLVSFVTVAMAASLLGAVVESQVRRPRPAFAAAPLATTPPAAPAPPGSPLTLDTFRSIARDRTMGVVNISTSKKVKLQSRSPFELFGEDSPFFALPRRRQQPGGPERDRERTFSQQSLGSGFVIDSKGYVLTNRHVIDDVDEIKVVLANGHSYEAKLVGKDARTDVALIKIEPHEPLTVLDLGDSDAAEVGEWVMAIGQPFGLGNSVTVGVVSFKGRDVTLGQPNTSVDMLQTDAAINPGNSGGPLLNTRGQVVGINTMIATNGATAQNAGVGFAVPINLAKQILPQLREKGKVVRGWMGVSVRPLNEDLAKTYGLKEPEGAIVGEVTAGSPAEKAGFQPEDLIVEADGRPIKDSTDLTTYISSQAPGATVRLKVLRGRADNVKTISVTLGTFPDAVDNSTDEQPEKMSLGMRLKDPAAGLVEQYGLPRNARGALVVDVEGGAAAERAGLAEGDLIVSVNGTAVENVAQFEAEIAKAKAQGTARIRARRENSYFIVALRLQ